MQFTATQPFCGMCLDWLNNEQPLQMQREGEEERRTDRGKLPEKCICILSVCEIVCGCACQHAHVQTSAPALSPFAGWNMRQISPCQTEGGEGQGWGQRHIRGASHRNEYLAFLHPPQTHTHWYKHLYMFTHTYLCLQPQARKGDCGCSVYVCLCVCLALTLKTSIIIWLRLPMGVYEAYNRMGLPEIQYVNPLSTTHTHLTLSCFFATSALRWIRSWENMGNFKDSKVCGALLK